MSVPSATLLACIVAVRVFVPLKSSIATEAPRSPAKAIVAVVVRASPAPLRAAALKLVVNLPTGDVTHVVASACGVQTLVLPHTFVPDSKGATAQLLPFNIGVLTLVVPHTSGDSTEVLPHTVAPHTKVVPCTVGVQTLVVPHTRGDNTEVLPHTFVPDKDGDERLVVTETTLGKPTVISLLDATVVISLDVPSILRLSDNKSTSPIPVPASVLRVVAAVVVLALEIRPSSNTVITGIADVLPYAVAVTPVADKPKPVISRPSAADVLDDVREGVVVLSAKDSR